MGRVIAPLAARELPGQTIFGNRFVVECCETFHFHFRNLRFELTHEDFLRVAEGLQQMAASYVDHGAPASHPHLELGRAHLTNVGQDGTLSIELCENLYKKYPTGWDSRFHRDDSFVHIHWRDLRLEMSNAEFLEVASAFRESADRLQAWKLKTLPEVFELLDREGIVWAVLRNWQNLPDDVTVGPHSDLDLLVHPDHVARFDALLDAQRTSDRVDRVQRRVDIMTPDGPSFIQVDVRSPGDGYHPDWLSHRMLARRVRFRSFWVLHPEDHYLGIAYHMFVHKGIETFDYIDTLRRLAPHAKRPAPGHTGALAFAENVLHTAGIETVPCLDRTVTPVFPPPEAGEVILTSRYLGHVNGENVFSRVSRIGDTIRKRTTRTFLRHEYDVLRELRGLAVSRASDYHEEEWTSRMDIEPVPGVSLSEAEDLVRSWSFPDAKAFVSSLVGTVAAVAERGIAHRDIRADNILVSGNAPTLIDFGWATSNRNPLPEPAGDDLGGDARVPDGPPCDAYSVGYVIRDRIVPAFPEFDALAEILLAARADEPVDWAEVSEFAALIEPEEEPDVSARFVALCERGRYAEARGLLANTEVSGREAAFWKRHLEVPVGNEPLAADLRPESALTVRLLEESACVPEHLTEALRHHVTSPPKPSRRIIAWACDHFEEATAAVGADALRDAFGRAGRLVEWVRLRSDVELARGDSASRNAFLGWIEQNDPPLDLEAAAKLARLCAVENRSRWAVDVARYVVDRSPYDVDVVRILAEDAARRGAVAEALDYWRHVVTLDPSDTYARRAAGECAFALSRGDAVAEKVQDARTIPDDPVGILDFVKSAIAEQRLDDAGRGIKKLQGQFAEYRDAADVVLARLARASEAPKAESVRVVIDPLSETTYEEDLQAKRVQLSALVRTPLGDHPDIQAVWRELRDIVPPSLIELDAESGPYTRTG